MLLISAAGCVPPPPPAAAVQPQLPPDPVLAYVASGPIGRTAVVDEPALGGNVIVVIDTQYNAASGQICRTYAVTSNGGQVQHLACGNGDDWQIAAPLITSNN
jgi:hypothetical protein